MMDSAENRHLEEGQAPPPETPQAHLRDFLGALLLLLVSVAFAIAALQIPFQTSSWVWYTSPGIFALIMAVCLGGCSAAVGYRGIRGWLGKRQEVSPISWRESFQRWGMGRFFASVAIILVYIVLLGKVPFLVVSVGLILTLGTVFREGRFWDALRPSLVAALVVVVLAYAIKKVFGILLP
jgi:hypothetical protein